MLFIAEVSYSFFESRFGYQVLSVQLSVPLWYTLYTFEQIKYVNTFC